MDFLKDMIESLLPLCRKYDLQLVKLPYDFLAMAGKRFVLFLMQDFREQVIGVSYAHLNKDGELENWDLTGYFREKLLDRGVFDGYAPGRRPTIGIIAPKYAEMLDQEFPELLRGGKQWMKAYLDDYPLECGLSIAEEPFANEYLLGR